MQVVLLDAFLVAILSRTLRDKSVLITAHTGTRTQGHDLNTVISKTKKTVKTNFIKAF